MSTRMNSPCCVLACLALAALACAAWLAAGGAAAAQDAKQVTLQAPAGKTAERAGSGSNDFRTAPPAAATPKAVPKLPEPAQSITVYHLKHAKADSVVKLLAGMFDPAQAQFSADARTNTLLFRGTPEAAKYVEALLARFDVAQPGPERAMHVFELRNAPADDVLKVLSNTLESKDARWSVDRRRNCVLLFGPRETADAARRLIEELDRPAKETEADTATKVFQVKYADASLVLQVLQTMLAGHEQVRIALDKNTNAVVIAAPPYGLEKAAQIIQSLDTPGAGRGSVKPRAPCQLRILWLASGTPPEGTLRVIDDGELYKDLKGVMDELGRLHVEDVYLAGQVVVHTLYDGKFQMSCSPHFGGGAAELTVSGNLVEKGGTPELSLVISVTPQMAPLPAPPGPGPGQTRPAGKRLLHLETVIEPKIGPSHYVVLGAAPVDNATSVFVVQVIGLPR